LQTIDFGSIAIRIVADYYFQESIGGTKPPKTTQNIHVSLNYCLQQAAPGEVNVNLISYAFEFGGKIFNRGLKKKHVLSAAFARFSMNLFRDLFQRAWVRIDSYVELGRIPSGTPVNKETVSGPDVDNYPFAGREQRVL